MDIRWPKPTAYVTTWAMIGEKLSWTRDANATQHEPLYTRAQIQRIIANERLEWAGAAKQSSAKK